jgi:hypothetical protein
MTLRGLRRLGWIPIALGGGVGTALVILGKGNAGLVVGGLGLVVQILVYLATIAKKGPNLKVAARIDPFGHIGVSVNNDGDADAEIGSVLIVSTGEDVETIIEVVANNFKSRPIAPGHEMRFWLRVAPSYRARANLALRLEGVASFDELTRPTHVAEPLDLTRFPG